MKITGSERIQGKGFLLRPITGEDAELIVAASASDIPDWTYIPRYLDQATARTWIQRGFPARENGRAVRFADGWVQDTTPELRRLQLHVIVGNPGSGRVAEQAGYKYEGIAVHQIPAVNGFGPRDAEVYGMAIFGNNQSEVGGVLA